jgi:hypothetical protein
MNNLPILKSFSSAWVVVPLGDITMQRVVTIVNAANRRA